MNITKKLGHLLTAFAALTIAAGAAQAQQKLVISTWGFNGDLLEEHLFAPFEAANNVEIVLETGNNADRLNKVQVRGGSEVDVISVLRIENCAPSRWVMRTDCPNDPRGGTTPKRIICSSERREPYTDALTAASAT